MPQTQQKKQNQNIKFVTDLCSLFFFLPVAGTFITLGIWCLKQYKKSQCVKVNGTILKRHGNDNKYDFEYSFQGNNYKSMDRTDRLLKEGENITIYMLKGNPKLAYLENIRKPDRIYIFYGILCFMVVFILFIILQKYPKLFCFSGLFDLIIQF